MNEASDNPVVKPVGERALPESGLPRLTEDPIEPAVKSDGERAVAKPALPRLTEDPIEPAVKPAGERAVPKPALPRLTEDPIGDPASPASAWNIANALTVFRLVLVPLFLLALFADGGHTTRWRVIAWGVFAVASITDRIDGDIARKRGLVTEFGKLADPIADKALIGAALIGLSALHDLPWWVTVVMLVREIGVTLLRFWVIRHGVIPASRGGKLKTLLQAVGTGLFVLIPIGSWLKPVAWTFMSAAIVVALATGVDYVSRAIRLRRASLGKASNALG